MNAAAGAAVSKATAHSLNMLLPEARMRGSVGGGGVGGGVGGGGGGSGVVWVVRVVRRGGFRGATPTANLKGCRNVDP